MAEERDGERVRAKALLIRFLPRALQDGVLDEVEKRQLIGILTSGALDRKDVQEVFRDFLVGVHREIVADGWLTPEEVARMRAVVSELRIPQSFLPPEIAEILASPGAPRPGK